MQEQWRIRIKGDKRKQVDVRLLVQAVIALGKQLADEEQRRNDNKQTAKQGDAAEREPEL